MHNQNTFDSIEEQNTNIFITSEHDKRSAYELNDRQGFIKKVFGIVAAQLITTFMITALPFVSPAFLNMMEAAALMLFLPIIVIIATYLVLMCKKDLAR